MFRAFVVTIAGFLSAQLFAVAVSAAEYGTADEAKAMLGAAVIEMKADPQAAIVKFNDAGGAFRDRDLYVFCANLDDGIIVAHPKLVGTDLRTIKDANGKAFGTLMLDGAREGEITEVSYVWPRPDATEPVPKNSYIIGVGGHVCGVGYYQ